MVNAISPGLTNSTGVQDLLHMMVEAHGWPFEPAHLEQKADPAAVMTARGEGAGGEQDGHAADGEGGQAVAQGFVGCVGQDEGKNAESDQRECVVPGICLHLRSIWELSDPVLFFRKPVYRSADMRALLCDRVSIGREATRAALMRTAGKLINNCVRYSCGSTSWRRQVLVRLARMAAVLPPRGLPTNNEFLPCWRWPEQLLRPWMRPRSRLFLPNNTPVYASFRLADHPEPTRPFPSTAFI